MLVVEEQGSFCLEHSSFISYLFLFSLTRFLVLMCFSLIFFSKCSFLFEPIYFSSWLPGFSYRVFTGNTPTFLPLFSDGVVEEGECCFILLLHVPLSLFSSFSTDSLFPFGRGMGIRVATRRPEAPHQHSDTRHHRGDTCRIIGEAYLPHDVLSVFACFSCLLTPLARNMGRHPIARRQPTVYSLWHPPRRINKQSSFFIYLHSSCLSIYTFSTKVTQYRAGDVR